MSRHDICIVTPGYLSTTPRVVKEADALSAAGYDVTVVCSQGDLDTLRGFDARLLADKAWRVEMVRWSSKRGGERLVHYHSKIRHSAAQRLPKFLVRSVRLADLGEGRMFPELATRAASIKAELYIGHYPTGLGAAAHAAGVHGALLGYDIEDLHTGEFPEGDDSAKKHRIKLIESEYVPRCSHLTAVSAPVASAFASIYRCPEPVVVHNAFPMSERLRLDGEVRDRLGEDLSLYWFSQVVGLDRGLQDAIRAMGVIGGGVQIHLRGYTSPGVRGELGGLARSCGVEDSLFFHEPVSPGELFSRAAEHDVGLALERPVSQSRGLTVTNKLFVYLISGLALCATNTEGQSGVMSSMDGAGFVYPWGNVEALADNLREYRDARALLLEAKESALRHAETRWNWEMESTGLIESVDGAFGGRA